MKSEDIFRPGDFVVVKNATIEFYTQVFSICDPVVYFTKTPADFCYNNQTRELRVKKDEKHETFFNCAIEKTDKMKETALLVTKKSLV